MNAEKARQIIENVTLRGPMFEGFRWRVESKGGVALLLQCQCWRLDTTTDEWGWGGGSKRYVSTFATESEIVLACFALLRDYLEHEAREAFHYKHERILGPHYDVNAMVEFAQQKAYDARVPA